MTNDQPQVPEAVVACRLREPKLRERREAVIRDLFAGAESVEGVPDGVVLRLPGDKTSLLRATEFIAFERECCEFLACDLHCDTAGGPLTLTIRSTPTGVAVLREELLSFRT